MNTLSLHNGDMEEPDQTKKVSPSNPTLFNFIFIVSNTAAGYVTFTVI